LNQFNTLWNNNKNKPANIRENNRILIKLMLSKAADKYDAINLSAVALQSQKSHALFNETEDRTLLTAILFNSIVTKLY